VSQISGLLVVLFEMKLRMEEGQATNGTAIVLSPLSGREYFTAILITK
jgi:hypothetical protein